MDLDQLTPEQLERLAALAFGSNKSLNFGVSRLLLATRDGCINVSVCTCQ